jgi:hypothetical protein
LSIFRERERESNKNRWDIKFDRKAVPSF